VRSNLWPDREGNFKFLSLKVEASRLKGSILDYRKGGWEAYFTAMKKKKNLEKPRKVGAVRRSRLLSFGEFHNGEKIRGRVLVKGVSQ